MAQGQETWDDAPKEFVGGLKVSGGEFQAVLPSLSVGAEAANVIAVTILFQDAAGTLTAAVNAAHWYLADDATGETPTAGVPSGGLAAGSAGKLIETVANAAGVVISDTTGTAVIDVTEVGVATWYLVVLHAGGIVISPAITFA